MKKNALKILTASVAASFMLGGCFFDDQIPDLSDEEMRMVEEYAAQLLLKYDENYKAATLSNEEVEAERERLRRLAEVRAEIARMEAENAARKNEEQQSTTDGGASDSSSGKKTESGPVYTDIDDFFALEGLEIEYNGFFSTKTYPAQLSENDWQGVVTATTGNSLLVFNFEISNVTSDDIFLDMVAIKPRFTFRINNSFSKASMMTVLMNDLAGYKDTIPAGESREAVLIVEVTEAQAQSVDALSMIMRYDENRGENTLLY